MSCLGCFFPLRKIQQWKARLILSVVKMRKKPALLLSSDTLYHSRNHVLIHHQKVASEIFFCFLIQIHDTILELNAIYVAWYLTNSLQFLSVVSSWCTANPNKRKSQSSLKTKPLAEKWMMLAELECPRLKVSLAIKDCGT